MKNHPQGSTAVRIVAQLWFYIYFAHHPATGKIIYFVQTKLSSFFIFTSVVILGISGKKFTPLYFIMNYLAYILQATQFIIKADFKTSLRYCLFFIIIVRFIE